MLFLKAKTLYYEASEYITNAYFCLAPTLTHTVTQYGSLLLFYTFYYHSWGYHAILQSM